MGVLQWVLWALALVAQNFSFTFVSRARNSGSLRRHLVASIFSNSIWFFQFNTLFSILRGEHGIGMAVATGAFYTLFTLTGSLTAHYWALRTEKGHGAVGANKKYAQIPTEEWALVKERLQVA